MTTPHLKVLFVGPEGAGKTWLANHLCDMQSAGSSLPPTLGVRVLEYDDSHVLAQAGGGGAQNYDDSAQLWDVSSKLPDKCFTALKRDISGVVYVYNPEIATHTEQLEYWYDSFGPRALGLPPQCFLICQMLKSNNMRDYVVPQKISFASIQQPLTMTWENAAAKMKPTFDKYLAKVYRTVQERQRQEEEDVMKMG
ncbi:unnamed protein product [Amoebophrya sp. A120]|nr:unnamed protein product [Amoebophrya sp. A120]|eukprot:GSA120T00002203001.1